MLAENLAEEEGIEAGKQDHEEAFEASHNKKSRRRRAYASTAPDGSCDLHVDPDAMAPMPMLVPAAVPVIAAALVILAFDPARIGAAVGPAVAVRGAMESAPAALPSGGRRSGGSRDNGSAGKCNQNFHVTAEERRLSRIVPQPRQQTRANSGNLR